MRLFITSNCVREDSIGRAARRLRQAGFRRIELTGGTRHEQYREGELLELRAGGVEFLVHHFFPPQRDDFVMNVSSRDETLRDRTFALIRQAAALSRRLGENLYSIHAGYGLDQIPEMTPEGIFRQIQGRPSGEHHFYESLEFLDEQLPQGFRLAVENGIPEIQSHLCSPEQILRYLKFIRGRKRLGLLLDLGHLHVAATRFGFSRQDLLERIVDEHADAIFELHASANDGTRDAHGMCGPDSFEIAFLNSCRKELDGVPVVMEWHACQPAEARRTFERIETMLEA